MVGMGPKLQRDGTWVYTPAGAALIMVGLEESGVYIARHQKTIAQFIANSPIMDLCLAADQKPELCLYMKWWELAALDTLGIRAGHEAAEGGEETGA